MSTKEIANSLRTLADQIEKAGDESQDTRTRLKKLFQNVSVKGGEKKLMKIIGKAYAKPKKQ